LDKQDRTLVPTAAEVTPVIIKRADLKGAIRNRKVQKSPKEDLRNFFTQQKVQRDTLQTPVGFRTEEFTNSHS